MYKTQYKSALTKAGITYDDLSEKNKATYTETVEVEKTYKELEKEVKDTEDEEEKKALEESLEKLGNTLEEMDGVLCTKIEKNEFYKQNALKLAEGRKKANDAKAKAAAGQAAPAKKETAKPAPPVKKEEPNIGEQNQEPEKQEQQNQGTAAAGASPAPVVKVEVKAAPAGTAKKDDKKDDKKEDTKDDKKDDKKDNSVGKTIGYVVLGLGTAVLAVWGIPMPALNKKAFSFKFSFKRW